ncbi:type III-A CRISPR-associated RAMP protein Csm4 [Anaerophaga thermohalophila]|uniref:type III-A CRISPR-associated RAMP protein Csm4 n=1 Tax=Anaerophaga thermohalophila TaxID=177400 RepID=UPI000237BCD4|nr:type III-A CRISPR-associated RAMP protein Csm4 [Anaerophaga thermohalophila]
MLKKTVFKLSFSGPLHIGKGLGEAYDTTDNILHSDTISGLLASIWSMQNNGAGVKEFMSHYRVSSAFPFCQSLFFLPLPVGGGQFLNVTGIERGKAGKLIKKIEYLPMELWENLVTGQTLDFDIKRLSPCGKFLFPDNISPASVYSDELEQRVTVPRGGAADSVPFYFEKRFFSKDSGLYFFCETPDQKADEIEKLLKAGETIGIGTDKSVGNGQYKVERYTVTFNDEIAGGEAFQLLSLYCPAKKEIENVQMSRNDYHLIKRGGFIAGTTKDEFRHLRKKSLFMFTEGSLFRTHEPEGKIENVRPEWNDANLHPVFRDGRAFYLPVKL